MVVHALQLDVPGYPHGPRGAPRAGHVQLAVLHFPHRVHSGLLREKAQMVVRIVDLGVEPAVGNGREEGVGYGVEVAWARAGGENGGVGGTREIRAGGMRGGGYVWLVLEDDCERVCQKWPARAHLCMGTRTSAPRMRTGTGTGMWPERRRRKPNCSATPSHTNRALGYPLFEGPYEAADLALAFSVPSAAAPISERIGSSCTHKTDVPHIDGLRLDSSGYADGMRRVEEEKEESVLQVASHRALTGLCD